MADETSSPQTVEEAVGLLLNDLSEEAKGDIANVPESQLSLLHFGLGMYIRNAFGFWQGKRTMLESCKKAGGAFIHPDVASSVIIKALWARLQAQG
jgi:hypothetical protein